ARWTSPSSCGHGPPLRHSIGTDKRSPPPAEDRRCWKPARERRFPGARQKGQKPTITMKTVTKFPRKVREIENAWITLKDGCHLAARLWLPEDAEQNRVPAVLEYIPYRKRDGTVVRDHLTHPYIAGHGYACVRVDMRGNGESDGLMWDEYL